MKHFFLTVVVSLLAFLGLPGMALANTCAPAATRGTAPVDYKDYCWLDFSGYNDTTARSASGQPFSFTLPDLSVISMTLKTTLNVGSGTALVTKPVPSWSGAAFGNTAFIGIPGQSILYSAMNNTTVTVVLSGITVAPPPGGTGIAKYAIIVGDGESSNENETLSFTTNADAWIQLSKVQNGASLLYPSLAGVGTKTVTETGVAGTVGSYVFGSFNNPTSISSKFKAGGLQGFIVGVRYASISVVSQIVGQRYNAPDQFTYAVKSPSGAAMVSGTTSGTALNGFSVAGLPTIAASYPFVIDEVMASGSTGALANYTVSLTCTNANAASTTPLPTNALGASYTIPSLQYGDAVSCVFTNTPIFAPVIGTVYEDANHNFSQDGAETGTGVSGLYVKLAASASGVCQSPALQAALVTPSTGGYSLPAVPPGNYCLILDTNSTLGDITPGLPAGWLGTENSSGLMQFSVVSFPPETPQNLGLYHGSKLNSTVFADTGVGSGVANNGVKDGTEPGISGVTVSATAGASVVASTSTAGDGTYTLWIPHSVSGTVTVTPALPSGYVATGGSAGTTSTDGGSYSRPNVIYTAPAIAGKIYTGVNFGAVPPNTLAPNGEQTALPGTVVFYAHTFYAGSGGQVAFALSHAAIPSSLPWTQVLYRDSNCSGALDAAEPQLIASVTTTAGQTLCLIVKQFVPAGATFGAQNTTTLSAVLSYTGASPALSGTPLTVIDVTTVGELSALALSKRVSNLTQGGPAGISANARPGDTLQYTLTAVNNGGTPLSSLVINDATPAFTTYLSAACPVVLPAAITACSVAVQPTVGAPGDVQWTFNGSLAASGQLAVTYQVKLNQ